MKYYIIKSVKRATGDAFKGAIYTYHTGRKGFSVDDFDWHGTELIRTGAPTASLVKEHGYKNISGAIKGLRAKNELTDWETTYGFWKTENEIICVEIGG